MDIQSHLDKAAITEVLYRYCRGVDRGDVDLINSVYHEDALEDHGIWKGPAKNFGAFIVKDLNNYQTSHMITNILIELNGDLADCESYCITVGESDGERLLNHNRFLDRFERRDGEWRITNRLVVFDSTRVEAVSRWKVPDEGTLGCRGVADASYRHPYTHAQLTDTAAKQ